MMTTCCGIIDISMTYGKKNNKYLYRCLTQIYNEQSKYILIPYTYKFNFDKSNTLLYILHDNENVIHTIGPINILENTYEYYIYYYGQHMSLKKISSLDKNIVDFISDKYNLEYRSGHIFTIDDKSTTDFDDAISITDNMVSIYISNVPIILDYLNLWNIIDKRVSTIYLPTFKKNLLPKCIENLCSLTKGLYKICLVLDIYINGETKFNICKIKVARNYTYDSDKLINHKDYKNLDKYFKFKNPHELVEETMIKFNNEASNINNEASNNIIKFIYKPHTVYRPNTYIDFIEIYNKCKYSPYTLYNCGYIHITSPIRRLVDIINMTVFNYNILGHNDKYIEFNNKWTQLENIKLINDNTIKIKKLQRKCLLLQLFKDNKNDIFEGYVFNKINDRYDVYIPSLKIFYHIYQEKNLSENIKYNFKLYMLDDKINKIILTLI